jgi:formylglycine-generating enzyme required for sulfatase activity
MAWIPGGRFRMGSDDFYPEEGPVHDVEVDGFWMDVHQVTVAQFAAFVAATGHVTVAERFPDPAAYPDADPALLVPGSIVFRPTTGPTNLADHRNWWHWQPGAQWREPQGPGGGEALPDHPVTHVAYEDAAAYTSWSGKELPTEAEWEFAARGGLDGAVYVWGDDVAPGGRPMANTWQGEFPWQNLAIDGYEGTSPVGAFPANGLGLFDMAGNVWEWTSDRYRPSHQHPTPPACCGPTRPITDPRAGSPVARFATDVSMRQIPRRVMKGGSFLCAPDYCLRYRPAARQGQAVDSSTAHLGFRGIVRP